MLLTLSLPTLLFQTGPHSLLFLTPRGRHSLASEALRLFASAVSQGVALPHAWWRRVLLLTWVLAAMVLSWWYGATVTSTLTVVDAGRPLATFQDLREAQGVRVAVPRQYAVAYPDTVQAINDTNQIEILDMIEFYDNYERYLFHENRIYIGHKLFLRTLIDQDFLSTGECRFYLGTESIFRVLESFALRKGSPFTSPLNECLSSLEQSGLLRHWVSEASATHGLCDTHAYGSAQGSAHGALGMTPLMGVFVVWAAGIAAALAVYLIEVFLCKVLQVTTV